MDSFPVANMMNILDTGTHVAHTMPFDDLDRCLDLITCNGAKTSSLGGQSGIEPDKPANFPVLDASMPVRGSATACECADVDSSWRVPVQATGAKVRG
jgi:cytosine/adenosine deaminase-related metal-dependent hydrolase